MRRLVCFVVFLAMSALGENIAIYCSHGSKIISCCAKRCPLKRRRSLLTYSVSVAKSLNILGPNTVRIRRNFPILTSMGLSLSCWRLTTPNCARSPLSVTGLEAAYEATMLAAVLNKQRGVSNVVLLTLLGGGAFGNEDDWIYAAIRRALKMMSGFELDVRLVSYGTPSRAIQQMVKDFG
jgi:hypothetical protein